MHGAVASEVARESPVPASAPLLVPEIFGAPHLCAITWPSPRVCPSAGFSFPLRTPLILDGDLPLVLELSVSVTAPSPNKGPFGVPGCSSNAHWGGSVGPDGSEVDLQGSLSVGQAPDGGLRSACEAPSQSVKHGLPAGAPASASLAGLDPRGGFRSFFSCRGTHCPPRHNPVPPGFGPSCLSFRSLLVAVNGFLQRGRWEPVPFTQETTEREFIPRRDLPLTSSSEPRKASGEAGPLQETAGTQLACWLPLARSPHLGAPRSRSAWRQSPVACTGVKERFSALALRPRSPPPLGPRPGGRPDTALCASPGDVAQCVQHAGLLPCSSSERPRGQPCPRPRAAWDRLPWRSPPLAH